MILMMGIFATFAGFIYNDYASFPLMALGDSCYKSTEDATLKEDCVYPVGIDPMWYMGSNELIFMNSLKMKLSVILGEFKVADH